jgi:hypothetical protein
MIFRVRWVSLEALSNRASLDINFMGLFVMPLHPRLTDKLPSDLSLDLVRSHVFYKFLVCVVEMGG